MSIQDENQKSAQPQRKSTADAFDVPSQTTAPTPMNFSFHSGPFLAGPLSASVGSEYLRKLATVLEEQYKNADPKATIRVLVLDNTDYTALNYSCLVVAVEHKDVSARDVGYQILVVENTGDALDPVQVQFGNGQVDQLRFTSDACNDKLRAIVLQHMQQAYGNKNLIYADFMVVPRTFDIENIPAVRTLAAKVGLACYFELISNQKNFGDMNLAQFQRDSSLSVQLKFDEQQVLNAVGQPVRSDVVLTMVSTKPGSDRDSRALNSGQKDTVLGTVRGYVELVWAPVNPQAVNGWAVQQQAPVQLWAPRFVITSIDSPFSMSPAMMIMVIMASICLREQNNWMNALRPRASRGRNNSLDLKDIGILNLEGNTERNPSGFGVHIDTKIESFGPNEFGRLITALVQPGLMIAIDIPEGAPESSFLAFIAAAANGNQEAVARTVSAANQLTNGAFGSMMPAGAPLFVDNGNVVLLGTYEAGSDRELRDIRELSDYVAVANALGPNNVTMLQDWVAATTMNNEPLIVRQNFQKRVLDEISGHTLNLTGRAARVTFSGAAIEALAKGIVASGVTVNIRCEHTGNSFNNQRTGASYVSQAITGSGGASFANYGGGYVPAGGGGNFNSRWM